MSLGRSGDRSIRSGSARFFANTHRLALSLRLVLAVSVRRGLPPYRPRSSLSCSSSPSPRASPHWLRSQQPFRAVHALRSLAVAHPLLAPVLTGLPAVAFPCRPHFSISRSRSLHCLSFLPVLPHFCRASRTAPAFRTRLPFAPHSALFLRASALPSFLPLLLSSSRCDRLSPASALPLHPPRSLAALPVHFAAPRSASSSRKKRGGRKPAAPEAEAPRGGISIRRSPRAIRS